MIRSTERTLTTHGGRLPDPAVMGELVAARDAGDDARVADLTREGILEMLRRQREIGIDVQSDGEFYKFNMRDQRYYESRFRGIVEREAAPGELTWAGQQSPEILDPRFARLFQFLGRVGQPDVDGKPIRGLLPGQPGSRFAVTAPLEYRGRDAIERELRLAVQVLDEADVLPDNVFYPLLGPGWFTHFVFNEYYATDEEYVYALAEGLRHEYEAVVDAGFILQLDDPALADKFYMFNPPLSIPEYRRHHEPRIEATNHALRNIPEDRIRYHVCWGSFHHPHTTDIALEHIVDLMLRVNAQAYSIEAASVRHQLDYRVWEDVGLPEGKILIPGVIAHTTSNLIEPPELVAERILLYARIVGRENVIAGVDCGPGGRCHADAAWVKLQMLQEGARLASAKLWPRHVPGAASSAIADSSGR